MTFIIRYVCELKCCCFADIKILDFFIIPRVKDGGTIRVSENQIDINSFYGFIADISDCSVNSPPIKPFVFLKNSNVGYNDGVADRIVYEAMVF